MMRQVFITAIEPKIEYHTRAGGLIFLGIALRRIAFHQFRISTDGIHVGNQRITGNAFAIGGHAAHRAADDLNIRHLGIGAEISAE